MQMTSQQKEAEALAAEIARRQAETTALEDRANAAEASEIAAKASLAEANRIPFDMPIAEWRRLLDGTGAMLGGRVEPRVSTDPDYPMPPECRQFGMIVNAERVRGAVAEKHLDRNEERITLSIGVTEWHKDDGSSSTLIAEADRALFEAKAAGRNRVVANHPA